MLCCRTALAVYDKETGALRYCEVPGGADMCLEVQSRMLMHEKKAEEASIEPNTVGTEAPVYDSKGRLIDEA